MKAFESYILQLETLALQAAERPYNPQHSEKIIAALDGQPYKALRKLIPLIQLRKSGAFFTSKNLAHRLVEDIIGELGQGTIVFDPACGAGDLLTSCAQHLPTREDWDSTINFWGKLLVGNDIYPEFIKATKIRLALVAISKGIQPPVSITSFDNLFPGIRINNTLKLDALPQSKYIVLNPPFTSMTVSPNCTWGTGKVTSAAVFLDKCILSAEEGTEIIAVLPEVLRVGSQYLRWRRHIGRFSKTLSVKVVGQFDPYTDVDVFILHIKVSSDPGYADHSWWKSDSIIKLPKAKVGDQFDVRVGPVVPYRDPNKGRWHPYIHAQDLPRWGEVIIDSSITRRRYAGTVFKPPFVVIRRTSRPSDPYRAVGTIISGTQEVAVENHLLVLKPKSGTLMSCRELIKKLRSAQTNSWLNERIRCRHLTVPSVQEIPW